MDTPDYGTVTTLTYLDDPNATTLDVIHTPTNATSISIATSHGTLYIDLRTLTDRFPLIQLVLDGDPYPAEYTATFS